MRNIKLLILLCVVAFSACQSDKSVKLGFIYSTPNTERYIQEANFFKEYAEKNGATVYVEHGDGDENIQYQRAIELFDMGIDGLAIIAVNANTAAAIVREGHERGIKVMAYNRLIKNSEVDFFVSGDNVELGKMMVDEIIKVKPTGTAIILGGDKYDRNAVGLSTSIHEHLKPHIESGNIDLLYDTFIEDWSDVNAAFELEQFISLSGQVPDIIFAGFDGMADGCIKALEEMGVEKPVYLSGQDATIDGVKNIVAGKQQMTAFHPLKEAASQAAEVMLMLVRNDSKVSSLINDTTNNGQIDVPTLKVPSIAVTKENVDQVLIKEAKFYTREQIYE
ncbi:substrate-binding domain-containing protein [Carboxylicivirga sp. A043]|uniref:substrate-binding domain-containing protein n=1 Tax=Carboxylicivirga litoralis TaxID=2816963 RepID=UPI0021CB8594|nr:substrate-binding domain-containing protein [Carboxylicivirga sp. A043]MCU4157578.1 substrate-binding domain-containing protein [Carboxylicivirga sp. A043]